MIKYPLIIKTVHAFDCKWFIFTCIVQNCPTFLDKVKKSLIVINKDTGQILINLLHC